MSIRTFIKAIFADKPYILTMSPVLGAVQMIITRGDKPVDHHHLLRARDLPPTLRAFLHQQAEQTTNPYLLTFPLARQLRLALASSASETFQLHTQDLDILRVVDCPLDFQIVWSYEPARQTLVRQLQERVSYLGDGWFSQNDAVWQLVPPPDQHMLYWISKPKLYSDEIGTFLVDGLRVYNSPYLRCELRLETGFNAALHIIAIREHSMDVQLVSNMPELQSGLHPLKGDQRSLISGTTLLPWWYPRMRGRLLDLARSGQVTRLAGEDLLAFIQDDLGPNAEVLCVDISKLRGAYPIHDGASLSLTWQLSHAVRQGVGGYWAVPYLGDGAKAVALHTVLNQFDKGTRFLSAGDAWLEYTAQFKAQCAEWKQKNAGPIRLAPQEVLGSYRDRLTKLRLSPPQITIPDAETEHVQVRQQIATLRQHGLPVGIAGLQKEIHAILAQTCTHLIQEHAHTRILWVSPRSKYATALAALQQAGVHVATQPDIATGQVLLATPDTALPGNITWTLIICSELDLVVAGSKQAQAFAALKRLWMISTFSRPDWHQYKDRAQHILRALGLRSSDLHAFVQQCMRTYTEQKENPIIRLSSPFKKLFMGSSGETAQTSVPIPPRSRLPEPQLVQRSTTVFRPDFTTSVTVTTPARSFLQQAQDLASRTGKPVEHVPFMHYWPTYEDMSESQRQWFFYWRSLVRQGQYPATDLSYLFVHIYEVLHLVGFNSAQHAFAHLVRLWKQYRSLYPRLDTYLIDWLADFLVVYCLPQSSLDYYAWVISQGGRMRDQNLAIEAWLSSQQPIEQIPDELLILISAHNPARSKFYQQHNTDGSISQAYRQGLAIIDAAVRERHGMSLFGYHRPAETICIRRQPFASAVYEGKRTEIEIATVARWAEAEALQMNITSILKYTENLLRRQHQFKGTLKGIELPQEWMALLDAAFPAPEPESRPARKRRARQEISPAEASAIEAPAVMEQPIVIDFARVYVLAEESNAVRDRLSIEENETHTPADLAAPVPVLQEESPDATEQEVVPAAAPAFNLERPENTPDHLLTDLLAVTAVLGDDADALALLRYLQAQEWEADSDSAAGALEGTFVAVVLDRINERALDELGDHLIFDEAGTLVVAEDYRDELEHLFTHSAPVRLATSGLLQASAYDDLAPEWAVFVQQLQPHHWETLAALLGGVNVQTRLAGIAQSVQSTPDLLIDEINEYALVNIGDIIIEAGDPPVIEEEDYESVQALVDWALQHEGVMA